MNSIITQVVSFLKSEGVVDWDSLSIIEKCLWHGVFEQWWEWVDRKRMCPIPFPKVVNVFGKPANHTMAHVFTQAGLFESVTEARKAGWNKPAELGEFFLFKRTERVIVVCVDEMEN